MSNVMMFFRPKYGSIKQDIKKNTRIYSCKYMYCYLIQEFRSFLIAHHLKHIVSKGEKNEEAISIFEIISLIQAAANFLMARCGQKPEIKQRKSLTATIVKLFPRLNANTILKKLDQRIKNVQRTPKVIKKHNEGKSLHQYGWRGCE